MKILVTGVAGFIGHHLTKYLLKSDHDIVGIDSLNEYYSILLKYGRLNDLGITKRDFVEGELISGDRYANFRFAKMTIEDQDRLGKLFKDERFDIVINLAAQAGVRYSLENPYSYITSNVMGFVNILECCRQYPIRHLLYASSSSVYGSNTKIPFCEDDDTNDPISLYAATKKSDELIAKVYAKLFGIPSTGLRFFTVYGPWGRPDMAPMIFTKSILEDKPIKVFNNGNMSRDFTYIDDIVEVVAKLMDKIPMDRIPTDIYNIGCGHPVALMDFITVLENAIGKKAKKEFLPMQKGDVFTTYCNTDKLRQKIDYKPTTSLENGISDFIKWYLSEDNPLLNIDK